MKLKKLCLKILLCIPLLSFGTACFSDSANISQSNNSIFNNIPENLNAVDKDDLLKNRQFQKNWEESKIENYDIEFQVDGGGVYLPLYPVNIKIRNGKVSEVRTVADGKMIENIEIYERYIPVGKLFDIIESEITGQKSDVKVVYDSNLNFPKTIDIYSRSRAMDGDYIMKINKLTVIK